MRLALVQMEVKPGNSEANLATILGHLQRLAGNANLVLFPELCVSGYFVGDRWTQESFIEEIESLHEEIRLASERHALAVIFGSVWIDRSGVNQDGRVRLFNAAIGFENGKPIARAEEIPEIPLGIQPKTLLPNYRFFDDKRYFSSLQDLAQERGVEVSSLLSPWVLRSGKKIGVQLCEDLWCEDYRLQGKPLNTATILTQKGAELIVNLSASPWTYGKTDARHRRVKSLQMACTPSVPFIYVNRVGAENCGDNIMTYDGASAVYHHSSDVVWESTAMYQEEVWVGDLRDLKTAPAFRYQLPLSKIDQKFQAIVRGLRHLVEITGTVQPKVMIGLSGGVDSAVVACLIEQAFGNESLETVTMPGRFTSEKTLCNARAVATALGVPILEVPIVEIEEAARRAIDGAIGVWKGESLPHENEQARIRGSILLSGLAARRGAFYTCNGNKLETALGYATLYGDVNGAIAPIADLTKIEVIEMARFLNEEIYRREVIPSNLLPDDLWHFPEEGVAPSAELRADQIDPMKFGYHDALLEAYLDFHKATPEVIVDWFQKGVLAEKLKIDPQMIERWGVQNPKVFIEDLEWFTNAFYRSVFKRVQAPPIIVTSRTAFGYDLRESIGVFRYSRKYLELKAQVLGLR
jgi:NAD+ synthase (glutamine-hydrolysing)